MAEPFPNPVRPGLTHGLESRLIGRLYYSFGGGDGVGPEWLQTGATWALWLLRKVKLQWLIYFVRDRATQGIVKPLHLNILHRMRRLVIALEDWDKDRDQCVLLAQQIASECRRVMGAVLELKSNELHCCIKVMTPDGRVATWVRSEPCYDRPVEQGDSNSHAIEANSVWSALSGVSDGTTNWQPAFTCFACNDLFHNKAFQCDRKNWQNYYRSALVFPLRVPKDLLGTEFDQIGFLAFDSPIANAFRGLPNIFDYRDDPNAYRDKLEASVAFNTGAIMADTLGAILGRAYQRHLQQGSNSHGIGNDSGTEDSQDNLRSDANSADPRG